MKKVLPFIIIFFVLIVAVICLSLYNAQTTVEIVKNWSMKAVEKIEIYGSEQPLTLKIEKTKNKETSVILSGKVSKSAAELLEQAKIDDANLYVPLSKRGFKLTLSSLGKSELTITVKLAENASFKEIFVDTLAGNVNVIVPKSFDGKYDVVLNSGAKLLEVPDTNKTMDSVIKIDAYSDVRITKEA